LSKLQITVRRKLLDKVRACIGKGYSDEKICDKLELRLNALQNYKKDIFDTDRESFENLENSVVYSDYLMKQSEVIRELQKLHRKYAKAKLGGHQVAALKLQSDIYDRCLKTGQDFGFIDKKSQTLDIEVTSYRDMSNDDIKKEIAKEVKNINSMTKGPVIDIRPEISGAIGSADELVAKDNKTKRKMKLKARLRIKS